MPESAEPNYFELIKKAYFENHPDINLNSKRARAHRSALGSAYKFAKSHLTGERKDGSSELSHSAGAALLSARDGHDMMMIVSLLLHDLGEDYNVPVSEIRHKFGNNVAEDVDMLSDPRLLVDENLEPIQGENNELQWIWANNPLYCKLPKTPPQYHKEKNEAKYARMRAEANVRQWLQKGYDFEMNFPSLSALAEDRQHEYKTVFRREMPPIFARLDPLMLEYFVKRWFPGEKIPIPALPMPKDKVLFFPERPDVIATELPPANSKSIRVYSPKVDQPHANFEVEIPKKYDHDLTRQLLAFLKPKSIGPVRSILRKPMERSAGHIFHITLEDPSDWKGFRRNLELFHDNYLAGTRPEHELRVSPTWRR